MAGWLATTMLENPDHMSTSVASMRAIVLQGLYYIQLIQVRRG